MAGFISEWWPASFRCGGRHQIGIGGRIASEFAATHAARIDEGGLDAVAPQQGERPLLISAGRLHDDQGDALLAAEACQRSNALRVVVETRKTPFTANPRIQFLRRNVDSTNDSRHGNLPCPCDGRSSDCSVVRDNGGGPKAHPRLRPEGTREPIAARGSGRPPIPSQRRKTNHTTLNSRYKGSARRRRGSGRRRHRYAACRSYGQSGEGARRGVDSGRRFGRLRPQTTHSGEENAENI